EFAGIKENELGAAELSYNRPDTITDLDRRIKQARSTGGMTPAVPSDDALKVLLLDLSLFLSGDKENILYNLVEPPLGLMYLLTALNQQLGGKINGRIAKSRIDFDSYEELKELLEEFRPGIIGIRALTLYKHFFHRVAAMIRGWGIDVPIIAGGPYATSEYAAILRDRNIDLVVLGEGEVTFCHLVSEILNNNGKLPGDAVLETIPGIAYIPRKNIPMYTYARDIIMMDTIEPEPAKEAKGNPPCINKSSDGAYVIFTSGTTGKPKGVLVEHRNLISLMKAGSDLFGYNCRDVWSMFHSFCFDFSVWEMYGALLYGGRLIVIPKMIVRDPGQFLHVLLNQKVTILNQTPSAFYNLIDEALKNQSNRLCLRYIIFGGEALKPARLKGWREKYPGIKLVNMFGITETCVHVTYKEIGEREIEGDISNIGKPIPTLNTYIMSRHQKLMPPGTSGELYVGGEGVARGYLNRPELTAEKFQVNRFYKSYKTYIFYKSGDLARMNSDGEMVYLGRIDQQVQLRGYRIELGEIESRLLEHKGIKAAVVIDQNISGDLYLCAYIVPQTGVNAIDLEAAALREFLARQLPDYMIPSYIVQLEEIPLTSHGKIDRKGLPEPEINIKNSYHSTLSETEQKLAGIWQDVLRLKKVSSEDDFFDVGGDSIKAVRLVSRINERLKSNLKLVDIYSHKNIAELAELVDREENEAIKQLNKKVTANLEELKQRIFAQVVEQGKWNLAEIEDVYPMSEIEKGMVFSYMKYAGMGIYHDQNVYLLYYKNFDIELVKKVMTLLTMKNEILRTVFNLDEFEEPVQMVFKEPKLDFGSTDITGLPQDKQFELLETWLSEDRKKPFESSQILWRMHIFTLGKDWVCLMLVAHHAILDGWSTVTLMTEFYITYNKLKDNPQYVLPRLQSSYKDMIIREKVEKENERTRRYWQEELRDYTRLEFSETTKGKAEMALMKIYKYNGGEELLARARQAAALRNTDIKNLCFSAYAYMMRMFSYENDMVLGCVTHTRTEGPDGDKVLGCFLNTVPVRLKIPTPLSWHEYVVMVERKMMEVKKHERLSLFEIALLLDEKNKDRNPFFDTLLNFTDFHLYRELDTDENIRITENNKQNFPTVELHQDTNTLFDFEVDITTGSLLIQPKYNVQVISDYVIKKCCIYFVNILEKYINEPDSIAHRDDILPLTEKEDLLRHFNDTRAAYSREKTMVLLFEEQVLKTQDNTAVIGGNGIGHITYRELNEKANQLGNGLRKMEVGKADFVGVVMERCLEMVTAVMGILKAGGAYVPLEPHLPDRRIEKILESLSTKCVITDSKNRPRFESMSSSLKNLNHIISLDKVGYRKFRNNSRKNPVPLSGPGDIAYIIYTSGSTGTPKGVVETHQPVVNVIEWVNKTFAVGKEDKLLFVASLGFDLSVYDIFGILASGASLRTVETKDMKEPLRLLDIMIKEGITFWDSAPAALQQLVPFFNEIKKTGAITKLRLVFLSGDWIPVSMPDAVKDTFKEVRIISLGGATEATIWSNYYPIGDVNPNWLSIPYGKPIQNAEYYILDTDLNLCPIHIAGDLYIGGECLAKEYKNDPVLTAAKFIDNPFCASGQGEKIYKTGDIARWLEDGNMQFLGRKDQQVKIRGYRIELGEIENHLSSFPGIREAIAIDRKDSNGNKYICAYYTIKKAGEKIAREELLAHLSKELPEYMMPAHFILIDQIPVTANGKLDRKSLPEPEFKAEDTYRAPENELQKKILAIWQEVLFRHNEVQVQIGIDDDFFELGGHSLNATIVIAKIHKMANVKVPLTEMFKCPTIRGLAEVIEKSSKEIYTGIKLAEKKDYYSLSSSQRRLYVLQQISPESTVYNLPIFLQLEGILDKERIKETMQKLLERHESLRTSFSMRNDEPIQRIPNEVEF
ncbi:MAG TPA: amino acid adenylation domain-containing protein, partial [Candidatus Kapabacteria bacterium]|nr:amino acid adenylation domain-containing protein [Candidatus Kapabacteria bacterium]